MDARPFHAALQNRFAMMDAATLTVLIVVAAVAFDFVNGFHDAANSIATLVATRAMKPLLAVLWAASFNFIAIFFFGTGVAKTVGSGMVALDAVTPVVILAGLIAAITWGLLTWWWGIPSSSSHALIGGYAGAALFNSAWTHGLRNMGDAIIISGWTLTLLFIIAAPVLGLALAHIVMKVTEALQKKYLPTKSGRFFAAAQMFSSASLSLMHGANDAQKTAGIIGGALVAGGYFQTFTLPMWVLWLSYGTMGIGTLVGGWRIIRTLGFKLTHLNSAGGFCAESSAAASILCATLLHLPVSTTHVTTGAILGVGSAHNPGKVRWRLARQIVWAWVLTIPAAASLGTAMMWIAVSLS